MYITIQVKYLKATDRLPSRLKASVLSCNYVSVGKLTITEAYNNTSYDRISYDLACLIESERDWGDCKMRCDDAGTVGDSGTVHVYVVELI